MQISFQEAVPPTLNTDVRGFRAESNDDDDWEAEARKFPKKVRPDGFRHPSLWPGQNGKTLTFNGKFE